MQIYWQGYSSIRIETKVGEIACTVMTDPFENEASIRFPRATEPDILVLSHQDTKKFNISGVAGSPFLVSDPGEYEVRGVFVTGIQDSLADEGKQRPVIYRIDAEDMGIAFLGGLHRELTNEEVDELGNIDILILPVGGGDAMEAKAASKIISVVEPRIVIPVNYHISGIKNKLGTVDQFCNSMGVCKRQDVNKLKVSKKDLPADEIIVTVIERS